MIRDVNADGLADRWGFGIEAVRVAEYEDATPVSYRTEWRVYEDGRVRAQVTSREWAEAVVDWLRRVPGLESNKVRR